MKLSAGFLLGLVLLGLTSSVTALHLQVPRHVLIVESRGVLKATVFNDSDSNQPLQVFFFAPMRFSITAPQAVSAHSKAVIFININNYPPLYNTVYAARLHVFVGDKNILQPVSLSFAPPRGELMPLENGESRKGTPSQNAVDANQSTPFMGLLSFGAFSSLEFVLQVFLVIIIIILAIAFFARFYNRMKGA